LREAAPALPTDIHQLIDRMVLRDRAAQLDDLGEAIEVLSRYDDEEPAA